MQADESAMHPSMQLKQVLAHCSYSVSLLFDVFELWEIAVRLWISWSTGAKEKETPRH